MATEKQINANRANAKLSQGPTSEDGQLRAALNNFRHGLAVKTNEHFGILYDENQEKFDELLATLNAEYAPTNETETILVRHMAQHDWLRARALRYQSDLLFVGLKDLEEKKFALFLRYETTHEKAFHKAHNELQNLRKQEQNREIGFESQQLKQAAENRAVEAQILRREQFNFKKEAFERRQQAQEQRNVAVKTPPEPSVGREMAA